MSKELKFVTRNYRRGVLDVRRAYRATLSKAGRRQKSEIRWMAAAAVIVVLLVGGAIAYMLPRQARETTIAAGQQNRVVTLADGTRVTLAPHSSIMYADDCRDIEMAGTRLLRHTPRRVAAFRHPRYRLCYPRHWHKARGGGADARWRTEDDKRLCGPGVGEPHG